MKPDSNLQSILYYFSQLDWDMLNYHLSADYTYHNTTKDIFLIEIKEHFEIHKEMGDSELLIFKGKCHSQKCTNCGESGYRLIGNNSRAYIDLIFKIKENDVRDIFECTEFLTELDCGAVERRMGIFMNKDEEIAFRKDQEYKRKVDLANLAYNEIITLPPRELDFDEVSDWLSKHENINEEIGWPSVFDPIMKWSHFSELYSELSHFISFINLNKDRIEIENNKLSQSHTEEDLIAWVVETEDLFYAIPLRIREGIKNLNEQYLLETTGKIVFKGDYLLQASKFILSHQYHQSQLKAKYFSMTKDEIDSISNHDSDLEEDISLESLQFHINNRKRLKDLGIEVPFYIHK